MKPKDAEKKLLEIVQPILQKSGFKRARRLEFLRPLAGGRTQRIGFSIFVDRTGRSRASFGVGVRFSAIEKWRHAASDAGAPTVGIPMHFLTSDRKYFDWTISDDSDWQALEEEISAWIKRALAFLARFATIDQLGTALDSNDPQEWFTLDPTSRIETIALVDCARGDRDRAITMLDQAIAGMAGEPAKTRAPLERLQEKLKRAAVPAEDTE